MSNEEMQSVQAFINHVKRENKAARNLLRDDAVFISQCIRRRWNWRKTN